MAAPKLKEILNLELVRELGSALARAYPAFDVAGFVRTAATGLDRRELTERAWHIAEAMHRHLPRPFAKAAAVLVASFGPEIAPAGENGLSPLRYMPHVRFIQKYGLEDFDAAMDAQYELTKRFTAEWSIRAFLEKYPERTYARLVEWARDGNAHVRRLVSEGTRPRLPWAARLRTFQADPGPVIALLEMLKDDPSRYVQRSVANNLNDIGKDHPERVVEICRRWREGASEGRAWIVKHALRSLVKKAHPGALASMGLAHAPEVRVEGVRLEPRRVKVGGKLRFSFAVASTARKEQDLLVDFSVHFVKANGSSRPKVFKLTRVALAASARVELRGTVSFAEMTTRKPYPGRHRIEAVINGVVFPLAEFDVRA